MVTEIIYQSIYSDYEGIKQAALYFDKIYILDEHQIDPTEDGLVEMPNGETRLMSARAILSSAPAYIQDDLRLLEDEGILEYRHLDTNTWGEQLDIQSVFDKTFFDKNKDLSGDNPEILDIFNGNCGVRVGDPAVYLSDYSNLYGFLASLGYCGMLEHKVPFCTDSELLDKLLTYQHAEEFERNRHSLGRKHWAKKAKEALLASRILDTHLPNLELKSFEDVLEVRYRLKDELEAFRVEISDLTSSIESEPWTPDFYSEIQDIADGKVNVSIRTLERKLQTTSDKLFLNFVENIKSPIAYIPLFATVFSGLPIAYAVLVSLGLATAEAAYSTHLDKKDLEQENGFSFLLKVRR